jgi:hypothetical protein
MPNLMEKTPKFQNITMKNALQSGDIILKSQLRDGYTEIVQNFSQSLQGKYQDST